MKNKEKAEQIAEVSQILSDFPHDYHSVEYGAIEMAKWKDEQLKEQRSIIRKHWEEWADEREQQLIEKACEWLNNNTISTTPFVYTYTASSDNIDKKTFIEQFKKAMEE